MHYRLLFFIIGIIIVIGSDVGDVGSGPPAPSELLPAPSPTVAGQAKAPDGASRSSATLANKKLEGNLPDLLSSRMPATSNHRRTLDQGGETIQNAAMIHFLPFQDVGTTVGFVNDYDEPCPDPGLGEPDVVYMYLTEQPLVVDISVCNGSNFDTKLYVYEGAYTPGIPYACNDDGCPNLGSQILGLSLNPGLPYFIVVDGSHGAQGSYLLTVTPSSQGCDVVPPPDYFPEGEPICFDGYQDIYNSGCNGPDEVFQPIGIGQTVFATSGTFLGQDGISHFRDTDWYEVYLPQPMLLTWQVTAEFDLQILVLVPGPGRCDDYSLIGLEQAGPCEPALISTGCVGPGPVWLWAGPSVFTGVPCGAEYAGTVMGTTCPVPPSNDFCANAIFVSGEFTEPFSTISATTDGPDEPALCTSGGDTQVGSDIWYCYTPECAGNLTVSLCGSQYDTKLAIYQTDPVCTCPSSSSAMACNDDFCGTSSQVTFPLQEGFNYLIRIGGWNSAQGNGIMTVTRDVPCPSGACVNVGYIQISPSDGLLNHYGRVNTCRVELTNLDPDPATVTLLISDCEQTITHEVSLGGFECRLVPLPFAWTPNLECQPNFITIQALDLRPGCTGFPLYSKPLPVARTPYSTLAPHDGVGTGQAFVPPGQDAVVVKLTPDGYPCSLEYVGLTMAGQNPDSMRDPIDVLVYDDSGPSGLPGNVLAVVPGLVTRQLEDFKIYAIPQAPIAINNGDFYVGFREATHCSPAGAEGIGVDVSYDHPLSTFLQQGFNWIPVNPPGDLLIEGYMRCPCPTQGSSPALGYNYITSDDPLGPEFNWVDITTVGTTWSDSCPSCTPQEPPYDVPFDNTWYESFKISLNGFISFLPSGLGSGHTSMPNPADPNAVIAPLWTECETCLDYSGEVYYYEDPVDSRIIIQWDSVLAQESERLWFEAILYPDGNVLCQYKNAPTFLDYTVGLESSDGTQALAVYQEGGCPPIHEEFAILFTRTTAPPGVQNLTALRTAGNSPNVVLRWEQLAANLYYHVYASDNSNFAPPGEGTLLGTTLNTSFTDAGAVNLFAKRFYRITVSNQPVDGGQDNDDQ